MQAKKRIFFITALLYIIYLIFPLFSDIINLPTWLLPSVVSFVFLLLYSRVIIRNKTFLWFLGYGVVAFLFILAGRQIKLDIGTSNSMYQLIIEYAFFLPSILMGIILTEMNDNSILKRLSLYSIVLLFISFVFILPQLNTIDLRTLTLMEENENVMGVMGYTLLHVYVVVFPVFIMACTCRKNNKKIPYLALLILVFYIIIKSSITTTLLIAIGILLFSFGYYNKSKFITTATFIFIISIFLYLTGWIINILDWIAPFFEDTVVAEKIEDMRSSLLVGRTVGVVSGRQNLHAISWNGFFSNIIIGGGTFGGHSCIVDRLACMGLLGFIPYVMIYISLIRQWKKIIVIHKYRYFYYLGIVAAGVLLYSKGLFGQEGNLFLMVLLPMLITYFQNNEQSSGTNMELKQINHQVQ